MLKHSVDGSRSGFLRQHADRRTLIWSLGLFPLPVLVAYLRAEAALWMLPITIYLSFCAGVLTHYHNHSGVFRSRTLNQLYSLWLSMFYGFPIFSWIPTHNQNHHKYTNGPSDATSTFRSGKQDSLLEALCYPIRSSSWQLPAVVSYFVAAMNKRRSEFAWLVTQAGSVLAAQVVVCALLIWRHGAYAGGLAYAGSFLLPALFAPYAMMVINYVQHVGCDPSSPDNHSRNFVGRWENWLVFEAGLHTVHHEHPGTHWSRYPELHRARQAAILPALNQRNVFSFVYRHYLRAEAGHLERTIRARDEATTERSAVVSMTSAAAGPRSTILRVTLPTKH
jgi:fatty acid desaturase